MVSVLTMTTAAEAIGVSRAARAAGMPVSVSFTVETDGDLPDGTDLASAVAAVDSDTPPAYFMVNCAHPSHFVHRLEAGKEWVARLRGVRANASRRSHAELDEATELDDGDPVGLAEDYVRLRNAFPRLSVLGGCCGTDLRHVAAIAEACVRRSTAASP